MAFLLERKSSPDIDAGGPIEDTDIAIQKMKNCGFDLYKDINRGMTRFLGGSYHGEWFTPMVYFVIKGDLKMCRYLFVNGAKCTQTWRHFPLYFAAREGHMDICKWLYEYGAKEEIQRRNPIGVGTPLRSTILTQRCYYVRTKGYLKIKFTKGYFRKKFSVSQWLILNGALCCQNDSGQIDELVLKRDLSVVSRPMFLSWAQEELEIRSNFLYFLYGTSQHKLIFNIGNYSGIMENIADYVGGIVRGRDLRILRQVANLLSTSTLIQEDEESSS
jgi:hypothetical protein